MSKDCVALEMISFEPVRGTRKHCILHNFPFGKEWSHRKDN